MESFKRYMSQILVHNSVQCKKCNDVIYSAHVHDFKWCSCRNIAVDGGLEYAKRAGNGIADSSYIEKSIDIDDQLYNKCQTFLHDCKNDNKLNAKDITNGLLDIILKSGIISHDQLILISLNGCYNDCIDEVNQSLFKSLNGSIYAVFRTLGKYQFIGDEV